MMSLLGACAGVPRDASLPIDDPYEKNNRVAFAANQAALHPVSVIIKAATPGPVHDRLHDLNANLREPRIFANDVLQLRIDAAVKTVGRFITNSTIGLGGLFDIAGQAGLSQQSGDFGQTLFVWGVPAGSYVVLPYFGPSTGRDAAGLVVDEVADPVGLALGKLFGWGATVGTGVLDAAVRLSEFKEAEDVSIDFYSFARSAYYQTRRSDLREAIGQPNVVESPATTPQR
ncbi:MAG: VacJ family lipoprotein [Hyphomicrobiales bacterium]|nr:VacJ family lipoprotein [Hyphomicrobiales bacterium]MBV9434092.1 VacJ family lipoprotein [Hyphomicrobiales bacterium]